MGIFFCKISKILQITLLILPYSWTSLLSIFSQHCFQITSLYKVWSLVYFLLSFHLILELFFSQPVYWVKIRNKQLDHFQRFWTQKFFLKFHILFLSFNLNLFSLLVKSLAFCLSFLQLIFLQSIKLANTLWHIRISILFKFAGAIAHWFQQYTLLLAIKASKHLFISL
jgi:hypothetical protein